MRSNKSFSALFSIRLNCTFSLRRLSPEPVSVLPNRLSSVRRSGLAGRAASGSETLVAGVVSLALVAVATAGFSDCAALAAADWINRTETNTLCTGTQVYRRSRKIVLEADETTRRVCVSYSSAHNIQEPGKLVIERSTADSAREARTIPVLSGRHRFEIAI